MNGDFIGRNVGTGNDFFSVSTRISRTFALSERWRMEVMAESFNALNHRNNLTRNGTFGTGSVSAGALVHVWTGDGGQRSPKRATGTAVEVLVVRVRTFDDYREGSVGQPIVAAAFLMMESPDRFNRALEDFLGTR